MFGVSCPQTVVIATLLIARAVIMAGEIVPVFFSGFHQITVDAEIARTVQLLSLRLHSLDKFIHRSASATLPVESADPKHPQNADLFATSRLIVRADSSHAPARCRMTRICECLQA